MRILLLFSGLLATAAILFIPFLVDKVAVVKRAAPASCNIFVDAYADPDDLLVCELGASVNLFGDISDGSFGFRWEPAAFVDDPNSLFPTAEIFNTTTFRLIATGFDPNAPNLVTNGDFGQGGLGFTSDYTFVEDIPTFNQEVYGEGTYSISSTGPNVHPDFAACSDQDGSGQMMIVNGAGAITNIWCQEISIQPNRSYNFSAWVATMVSTSPTELQFTINGEQIGNSLSAPFSNCSWERFSGDWFNQFSTTATLCILNLNTSLNGNDFAIDNISFTESCVEEAEVTIELLELEADITGPAIDCNDPESCVTLNAALTADSDWAEYEWNVTGGDLTILSGENSATPEVCGSGNLLLSVQQGINGGVCEGFFDYTVEDNNAAPPTPNISGEDEFCAGNASFSAPENVAYATYRWTFTSGVSPVGPTDASIFTGDFTNAPSSGEICLRVTNHCGRSRQNCRTYSLGGSDTLRRDSLVCEIIGPGSLIDTIPMASGCDIIEITRLVLSLDTVRRQAQSCSPLDIGIDTSIVDGGTDCDTVLILSTTLLPPDTLRETVLTCTANDTGVVMRTLAGPRGCDTILLTTLVWDRPDTAFLTTMSCIPLDTGVFQSILPGPMGCDTILLTTVEWKHPDTIRMTDVTCIPSEEGLVIDTLPGPDGCDTIVLTGIEYVPPDTLRQEIISCVAQDTGVFQSTIAGPLGCDTILITTVSWDRPDTTFATAMTCVAQDTGVFQSTIAGPLGCDTILITTVSWDRPDTTFATAMTCVAQDTGVFQSTIAGPLGCDTILITTVSWD
ncbi:MAG: hypothetical protein AAF828_11715, partial [Bacteroidota bacterium]